METIVALSLIVSMLQGIVGGLQKMVSTTHAATPPIVVIENPHRNLFADVFAPLGIPIDLMERVADCESNYLNVKNPLSSAMGIFQIVKNTARTYNCGDVTDPKNNVSCAAKIYQKEKTAPWSASRACWDRSGF